MRLKLKLIVRKINKPTKAKLLKDLKVGDEILISSSLQGGYHSAPYVQIENIKTGEKCTKYFSETRTLLRCFEFEEIE